MKIEAEITDGFLLHDATGEASTARVASIAFQKRKGGAWSRAKFIVQSEDVPTVLEAAAAHIRNEAAAAARNDLLDETLETDEE